MLLKSTGLLLLKPKACNLLMVRSHRNQQLKYNKPGLFWELCVLSRAMVIWAEPTRGSDLHDVTPLSTPAPRLKGYPSFYDNSFSDCSSHEFYTFLLLRDISKYNLFCDCIKISIDRNSELRGFFKFINIFYYLLLFWCSTTTSCRAQKSLQDNLLPESLVAVSLSTSLGG